MVHQEFLFRLALSSPSSRQMKTREPDANLTQPNPTETIDSLAEACRYRGPERTNSHMSVTDSQPESD